MNPRSMNGLMFLTGLSLSANPMNNSQRFCRHTTIWLHVPSPQSSNLCVLTARDEVYRVVEAISKRVEKCHALGLGDHEETLSIRDVLKLSVDRGEQNFPTSFPNIPHAYECG